MIASLKGWISRHRLISAGGALLALGATIFVLVWFQPQKLFLDQRVNESAPEAVETVEMDGAPMAGTFIPKDHGARGSASVLRTADGSSVLRFGDDFSVQNGPDLFVYLSPAEASAEGRAFAEDALVLAPLKGNVGAQNYTLPAGIDLTRYRSVVIWCRRFATPFAAAPLV